MAWLIPVLCNSELMEWSSDLIPEIKAAGVRGSVVAAVATALTLPIVVFSRRYLHGEYMYARFFALCFALLLGFNWVATSPSPTSMGAGYSLLGLSSTFLIGMYNERPSVRANGTLLPWPHAIKFHSHHLQR
jgi:NADH:ubiquinone oxidoreductase subunit 5 (subunit L)/multisubunit Na+/H+ antiporter MnhA subunit